MYPTCWMLLLDQAGVHQIAAGAARCRPMTCGDTKTSLLHLVAHGQGYQSADNADETRYEASCGRSEHLRSAIISWIARASCASGLPSREMRR